MRETEQNTFRAATFAHLPYHKSITDHVTSIQQAIVASFALDGPKLALPSQGFLCQCCVWVSVPFLAHKGVDQERTDNGESCVRLFQLS